MAKTVLKGLAKNKGDVGLRIVYAPGWYKMKVTVAEERASSAGDPMFHIEGEILEAPEQKGGQDVVGKTYFHNLVVISGHEYEELMVSKVKNFLNAAGIRVAADDSFNFANAADKVVWGRMTNGVDKRDGTQQSQVQRWEAEDFDPTGGAEEEDED